MDLREISLSLEEKKINNFDFNQKSTSKYLFVRLKNLTKRIKNNFHERIEQ